MTIKKRLIYNIFMLCSITIFFDSCTLVDTIQSKDRIFPESAFITELDTSTTIDSLIDGNPISKGFKPYNYLPFSKESILSNKQYLIRFQYNINSEMLKKELMLFIPAPAYPQEFYFNGHKIYQSGLHGDELQSLTYSPHVVLLNKKLMKINKKQNELAVKVYASGERRAIEGLFLGEYKEIKTAAFWYTLFHAKVSVMFLGISFLFFIIFFFIWKFTNYTKHNNFYFSLFSLALFFSYLNMVFSSVGIPELYFWKISRMAMCSLPVLLLFFIMEFTNIGKDKKIFKLGMILLVTISIFLIALQPNKIAVNIIFEFIVPLFSIPVLLTTPVLLIIYYKKTRKKRALSLLFAMFFLIATSIHDIYILKYFLNPYAWLIPIGYIIMQCVFAITLAYDQGTLIKLTQKQSDELKISYKKIEKEKELVQKSDNAKSTFLTNMAHEFRTPLSGIEGTIRSFIKSTTDNDLKNDGKHILKAIKRFTTSVNSVINFSELNNGTILLDHERFALDKIFNDLILITEDEAIEKNVKIKIKYLSKIPNKYFGDRRRILTILENIVNNGIKNSSKSNVTINVNYKAEYKTNGKLIFNIIDNGTGIPSNIIESIFLAFHQAENGHTKNLEGIGLGLTISAKIIQAMNGHIDVQSSLGDGTVFIITLPIEEAPVDSIDKKLKNVDKHYTNSPTKCKKILVVEDDKLNSKVLCHLLQKLGHEIDKAETGIIAVDKALKKNYDLILMDVQMPEMNGLTATKTIRKQEYLKKGIRIPIVALTANAKKVECLKSGMDDYMEKPVNQDKLIDVINEYCTT